MSSPAGAGRLTRGARSGVSYALPEVGTVARRREKRVERAEVG